ncbi:MAG: V-type ATP synthase subunit E family protein [Candidatus Micrarchaeota archaeon]
MAKVAEQIIEGAKKEASAIVEKAEGEAKAIENEKKAIAEHRTEAILRNAEEKAKQVRNQVLASAHLTVRQSEVDKKQKVLSSVFDAVRTELGKVKLSQVFPKNAKGKLYVAKEDMAWAKKHYKGTVSEIDILGGYILDSDGIIINNSFDVILENMWGEFSAEVLKAVKG